MFQSFRHSMTWLHTWFGLVLGYVLMVVFFFGSLSVFDREIDRWTAPPTRFEPQPMPSYDKMLAPIFQRIEPDDHDLQDAKERVTKPLPAKLPVLDWGAYTTHRDPVLLMWASFALPDAKDPEDHIHGTVTIDPRTGKALPNDHLKIGSGFFYPMHYGLNLHWMNLGYWIVGLAALVMLAALVSGVVMHRKIFREFFTFRPKKQAQRSALDLHNLTGVVALPFHFMFALSGLIIFSDIYLPVKETMLKPVVQAQELATAQKKGLPHKPAGEAAPLASVDAMVAQAQARWASRGMAGEVGYLFVNHIGDKNAYVSVYRSGTDRVATTEGMHFSGVSGRLLYEEPATPPVATVRGFVAGLHLQQFRHWSLRWLYFFGGLAGCICIATGFIFFVEKRKRQHAARGLSGARWADGFAVTTVTGTVIATLAMLVGNRLLPTDLPRLGAWEQAVFWGAWGLAMAHALWRTAPVQQAKLAPAWAEQCGAVAVLAVAAVLLNWVSTGDHLLRTLSEAYWPVAGMDLVLLTGAVLAAVAARRLRQRARIALPVQLTTGRTDSTMTEASHA